MSPFRSADGNSGLSPERADGQLRARIQIVRLPDAMAETCRSKGLAPVEQNAIANPFADNLLYAIEE